nr:hypothetical protein [Deltaproteobacteria bacterium]
PRAFDDEDHDDQLKALPRERAARGSTILSPPPIPARARRATTLPPPLPSGARRISAQHAVPSAFTTNIAPSKLIPFLPPPEPPVEPPRTMPRASAPPASMVPPVPRAPTHDEEPHVARAPLDSFDIDVDMPEPSKPIEYTAPVPRRGVGVYIAAGLGAAFVVGVLLIYFTGKKSEPAPDEPAVTAAPAPQPEPPPPPPAAAPPPTPEPPPAPQPVAVVEPKAEPPPSSADGEATLDRMMDDMSDEDLARLEARIHDRRAATAPETEKETETVKEKEPEPAPTRRRSKKVAIAPKAEPKPTPEATAVAKPKAVAAAPSGTGVLMVSSKPPCNIAIDGKPTQMVTPQRAISLSAGVHKITLTNTQQRIAKTISVTIDPKKPTKLIQDFTKQ